jgi:serine phosphatase RsbU (regulator of sigma subunit)
MLSPEGFWNRFAQSIEQFGQAVAKFAEHMRAAWERVTEGMALNQLWDEFRAEAQAGYKFYSADVDWASFQHQSKGKRRFYAARALSWALLRKLSPARRVLLLLTLAFVIINSIGAKGNPAILVAAAALVLLLALELADRVIMKRDLEIAREIQQWLVPKSPPVVVGFDIAFATRAANTVSGDYYDAFLRDRGASETGRLLCVVADVAGKSIPAALLMATIQASLRTLAASPLSLLEIVLGLNRYACANSLSGARFTTAFVAELDTSSRTLTYINAGHNPPILRRGSGGFERLDAGGVPLGVLAAARYEQGEVALQSSDLLVVFTDGVVEAENEREEEYGEARLLEVVKVMQPATATHSLKAVISSVDAFVGATRQHDDITAMVVLVQ